MVYEQLKADDGSDSDVDSIQRSPLLETGDWVPPEEIYSSDVPDSLQTTPQPSRRPSVEHAERAAAERAAAERAAALRATAERLDVSGPASSRGRALPTQIRVMSRQRPQSAILFPPTPAVAAAAADDDDDALPFERTRAPQTRPKSVVELSQLGGARIMTKSSFDNYRRSIAVDSEINRVDTVTGKARRPLRTSPERSRPNSMRPVSLASQPTAGELADLAAAAGTEDERDEIDDGEDGEDDVESDFLTSEKEQKRRTAKERQIQDARLSIYRQSMTRVIGGSESGQMTASGSIGSLGSLAAHAHDAASVPAEDDDSDDAMDNVPLSILQAHGFPKERRRSSARLSPTPSMPSAGSPRPETLLLPPRRASSGSLRRTSVAPTVKSLPLPRSSVAPPPEPALRPLSNVFEDKDAKLGRGLVGRIEQEQQMRRLRQFGSHEPIASPEPPRAPAPAPAPQAPEIGDLARQIEFLIGMLQGGPGTPGQMTPGLDGGPRVHGAASVRSFNTFAATPALASMGPYGGAVPAPGPYMPQRASQYSPGFAYDPQFAQFQPGPAYNPHAYPGPGGHLSFAASAPQLPGDTKLFNQPSRVRLVDVVTNDDDDDAELERLLEQRRILRAKWSQAEASSSEPASEPSETVA